MSGELTHDAGGMEVSNWLRLLYPRMRREATTNPVILAFLDVRGRAHCESLRDLCKRGRTLIEDRCASDRALTAAVFVTTAGPLLVTAHHWRPDDGDSRGAFAAARRTGLRGPFWAPRLALLDSVGPEGNYGDVLPLLCPRCDRPSTTTWQRLLDGVATQQQR